MKKGALELQDYPQGLYTGMARNNKTFQRDVDRRQKLIDSLYADRSKNNYTMNKSKGSKGGAR